MEMGCVETCCGGTRLSRPINAHFNSGVMAAPRDAMIHQPKMM